MDENESRHDSRERSQVLSAVESAVEGCTDTAAVELAITYARSIDAGGDLAKLGPALLAVLEALHLTPRARATVKGGMTGAAGSPLDELRQRRARRDGAPALDAATT